MGIKLTRQKKKNFLVSFFYFLKRIAPLSTKAKYKLFLNLEWIFYRFSYELSAEMYDYEKHPMVTYRIDFLKQYININHSVVDLGCGYGFNSHLISEFAGRVVGIDRNTGAIEKAKKQYVKENLRFYSLDAIEFLENNEKYNVLILSHILEHLDNPKDFLLRYKKYFDYLYIELPDLDGSILNRFRIDQKLSLVYSDADHVSEFDRNEFKSIFSECGLKELRSEYIFGIQRYWCQVIRAN